MMTLNICRRERKLKKKVYEQVSRSENALSCSLVKAVKAGVPLIVSPLKLFIFRSDALLHKQHPIENN